MTEEEEFYVAILAKEIADRVVGNRFMVGLGAALLKSIIIDALEKHGLNLVSAEYVSEMEDHVRGNI